MPIFAYPTSTSTPLHLTNNNVLLVACTSTRPFLRCTLCPSWGREIGASGARQRRRPKILGSRAADTTCSSTARTPELPSSRAAAARDGAVLCSTPCFCLVLCCGSLSLFVPISASRFRRASARASRSLSGSLEERTNQQCSARASCVFTEDLFFPLPLPGAAGFKKYGPAHQGRGIACTVLEPAL